MSRRPAGRRRLGSGEHFAMGRVTALLLCAVIGAAIWFSASYKGLSRSVQNERVESIGQIGTVILEKIQLLSAGYSEQLELAAALLRASDVQTMAQAAGILGEAGDLCLLRQDGRCFDLEGEPVYFLDVQALFEGVSSGETHARFGSVRSRGDYWIFSTALNGLSIDGVELAGLLKLVDVQTYADVTTNTLFDGQGATYVVNTGGVILMRPDRPVGGGYFQGYNLLSDLAAYGVADSEIATLRTALADNAQAQIVVPLGEDIWLIQTISDLHGRNLILTVPISITARDTFTHMRASILSMVLMVFGLALLASTWIFYFIRRDSELRLEQAKATSKSDFMSKVSHDIRTPLNAIIGMLEIAQRSAGDEQAVSRSLSSAKKSSEYLVSVINDVLDMSRIESGKMQISHEPFVLKTLLDSVMEIESAPAAEKKLRLTLEERTQGGQVHFGDEVRIKQCIINLVSNAIKFTPEGGAVTLRCEEQPLEDGRCCVVFSVEDTGIGMSEEFMEHMFSPFEQERASGTAGGAVGSGLGLSIVYHLVQFMGGTIDVTSRKGEGSLFVLSLPLEVGELPPAQAEEVISAEELRGRRVLLAEDNELNREIAGFLLRDLGLEVEEVEDGKQALDRFCEAGEGHFDLILMDIQMPVMDGLESARRIRASGAPDAARIPIVALSANAFQEDANQSHEAGMQAHLAKPVDPVKLRDTLLHYLRMKPDKEQEART